jgi:DNA repair photolyase
VLFVSKANLSCIKEICRELVAFKENLLIRVTIGSTNPMLCKFWERNAPRPEERLLALKHAQEAGFETSVSMEPILHGIDHAIETYKAVEAHVTEKIWIGAMNSVESRVDMTNPNFAKAVADLKTLQSKEELIRLYDSLKDEPKVLWKESISKLVAPPPT